MMPAATMRTLRAAPTGLGSSPLKSALLLATIALGVAALISALSISTALNRLMVERLERDGLVVHVYDAADPGQPSYPLNQQAVDALMSEVTGAAAASLFQDLASDEYVVGGTTYQVRTAVTASASYLRVLGLEMIAGAGGDTPRQAVISAGLAEVLYGSAAAALGQTLQTAPPRMTVRGDVSPEAAANFRRASMPAYVVRGVFRDPDELRRRVYEIADLVVGLDPDSGRRMHYAIALRATGTSLAAIESQVRAALARQYGHDAAVAVAQASGSANLHDLDPRSTVRTLSLILNLLAVLILITGGVGLLSLMMVEVLSRSRQIALARAFGASKRAIAAEFLRWSVVMAAAASAVGVVLSLFLSAPLVALVTGVFRDATIDLTGPVVTPTAAAAGVAAAIGVGGLLGPLPVFSALAAPIAEGIRDA